MSKSIEQVKEQQELLLIEESLWDALKKYPKLKAIDAIYILAGMIKYISAKAKL